MIFLGIDPGADGCIASLDENGYPQWHRLKGTTERDAYNWVAAVIGDELNAAVIERVSSSPQMGVCSAFTFGRGYGFLRGVLIATGVPFVEVTPAKWQGELGCRTKGDKNVSKARAQQLYPELKITHANADALLIATYCRRKYAELF